MPVRISHFSLLIPDYDTALDFFRSVGFECREDTDLGNGKRWVRIAPPGAETENLLAALPNVDSAGLLESRAVDVSGFFWKPKISQVTTSALKQQTLSSKRHRVMTLTGVSSSGRTRGGIVGI